MVVLHTPLEPLCLPNVPWEGFWQGQVPNHRSLRLALVGIILTYVRILAYLTLPSSGHLFLELMPSALRGVTSVTGPILEVLRYVLIPKAHARIRRTYARHASYASLALTPSEPQVQVDVSRTGRVTPIPSHVINMTLPGNPESYSDCLRERLGSPPKMAPRNKENSSVA